MNYYQLAFLVIFVIYVLRTSYVGIQDYKLAVLQRDWTKSIVLALSSGGNLDTGTNPDGLNDTLNMLNDSVINWTQVILQIILTAFVGWLIFYVLGKI